jgi:peptidoglycan-N-acetylglucosamine deacetylase
MDRGALLQMSAAVIATAITVACSSGVSPKAASHPQSAVDVQHGGTNQKVVALTFDAGYDPTYTAQILDLLKQQNVKATFAVTGILAERNPDLVQRMVTEGHALINHSYHHWHFVHTQVFPGQDGLTQAQRLDELDKTDGLIQQDSGASAKPYFRPPYGDYDSSVNADVAADGYYYNVLWDIESLGWQSKPPDQITPDVLKQAHPGAIILMHLGVVQDWVALPNIIDGLRQLGYGFTTVSEMIQACETKSATGCW